MIDFFSTKVAYADLNSFMSKVNTGIINPLIAFLFALAIVFFLYGVFEFIMNQENEEKKTDGKNHIVWGIVGITIMMGVWTILDMIIATFDIKGIDPKEGKVELRK